MVQALVRMSLAGHALAIISTGLILPLINPQFMVGHCQVSFNHRDYRLLKLLISSVSSRSRKRRKEGYFALR